MTTTTTVSEATPAIEIQPTISQTAACTINGSTECQPLSPEYTYENRLKAAVEHARRLTQMHGYQSVDTAITWETVEELRTANARRRMQLIQSCQSAFDRYCLENPEALECRSYDC